MTPSHFRGPGYIELVSGQDSVGSFEHEIERGKLGTTREAHEIHGNETLEWNHKRMWLAVVGRAVADATDTDMGDIYVTDEPEEELARVVVHPEEARRLEVLEATRWLRECSGDYLLVMDFLGLKPVARRIAALPLDELLANLREFEKREERERKERTKR